MIDRTFQRGYVQTDDGPRHETDEEFRARILKGDAETPGLDVIYRERRERLVNQVVARWTKIDLNDDELVCAAARTAADATYHSKINDLDWEAATLRRLGYTGETL